ASPDGLKTIRRQRGVGSPVLLTGRRLVAASSGTAGRGSADLDLRVADDASVAEELRDRLLVVLGVGLFEQDDALEEPVEAAFDDLRQGGLGLALVAADRLERGALGFDDLRRHLVTAEVTGPGEGDVHGDVVGERRVAAGEDDEDAVDAATALDVEVAVEDLALAGLDA